MQNITEIRREVVNIIRIKEIIIQRVIKDDKIQNKLSSIITRLERRKILDIYMNRSLVTESRKSSKRKIMGIR
jgi:hypothetical protein